MVQMVQQAVAFLLGAISLQQIHHDNYAEPTTLSQRPLRASAFLPKSQRARIYSPIRPRREELLRMSSPDPIRFQDMDEYRSVFNANNVFGYIHHESYFDGNYVGINPPLPLDNVIDCVADSEDLWLSDSPQVFGGIRIFMGHNAEFVKSNEFTDPTTGRKAGLYDKRVVKKALRFEIYSTKGCKPNMILQYSDNAWDKPDPFKVSDTRTNIISLDVTQAQGQDIDATKSIASIEFNQPLSEKRKKFGGLLAFSRSEEEKEFGGLRIVSLDLPQVNAEGETCSYVFHKGTSLLHFSKESMSLRQEQPMCPPHVVFFPGYGLEGLRM